MAGITLLGLGPGNPNQLTREAWEVLSGAKEIWLRTRQHPTVGALPAGVEVHTFDQLYDNGQTFEEVYDSITNQIMELGNRAEGVIYAVPGHPFVAEATGPEIARRAREEGIPLHVVEGLSFLEPTLTALGIDPFPHLALVDALEMADAHVPPFPTSAPAIVAQIH